MPTFVKRDYPAFYKAVFETAVRSSGQRAVFIEHVSAIHRVPPRAGEVTREPDRQLVQLGAAWPGDVVLTRLHFQYDKTHFPKDLILKETANAVSFTAQFAIHHPYEGEATCPEGIRYHAQLKARQARETQNLARLTGWSLAVVRQKSLVDR